MNKRFQYSKILPLITCTIFCICIYLSCVIDNETVAISLMSSSGTIFLTAIVWYLKNSQAEKVANIKANTYRIISEERLKYNEKMMELKSKYELSDMDINEIESSSPLGDLENDALNSMNESIDNAMNDATSMIEIQNI